LEVHQDTVPVDAMIIEPFGAEIRGGKLYGRGACDVKGGMTAMLLCLLRLHRERPGKAPNVTLACTVDEEHTFLGVQALAQSGERFDEAIVAEPTLLNIVNAHKGVVRWTIRTTGRACHSSRPQDGINAVYRMAPILMAMERYATELQKRPVDPLTGGPTISVGRIEGGVSVNTVPDLCEIQIDRRLLPGETAHNAIGDVEGFLKRELGEGVGFEFLPPSLVCPALSPALSGELTAKLGRSIDAVVGRHRVFGAPYGTDASSLAEAGIPAVVFGPGDIAQAHTKDEWIEIEQVEIAAKTLYHYISGGVE
jgi:acetylornithine deacetylase/succinyl-diaminopimelate desuccinylase-like protein